MTWCARAQLSLLRGVVRIDQRTLAALLPPIGQTRRRPPAAYLAVHLPCHSELSLRSEESLFAHCASFLLL
jgi:hypothetical protein